MAVGGITSAAYYTLPASQVASRSAISQNRNTTRSDTDPTAETSSSQALVGRSVSSLVASDSLGVLIQTQEVGRRSQAQSRESFLADAQKAGKELAQLVAQRTQTAAEQRVALKEEEKAVEAKKLALQQEAVKEAFQAGAQEAKDAIELRATLNKAAEAAVAEKLAVRQEQNKELIQQIYLLREQKASEQTRADRKAAIAEEQEKRQSLRQDAVRS
jgi:hypothetical protein